MQFLNRSHNRGFTLIEILVVIAIIGILSTIVFVAVNEARISTRDKIRVTDLETARIALRLYAEQNGGYQVTGGGWNGGGQGWFTYSNGTSYPTSVAQVLVDQGYLPGILHDPLVPPNQAANGGHRGYMIYRDTSTNPSQHVCVFAMLEDPTPDEAATINNLTIPLTTSINTAINTYNMNYAVCL